MNTRGMGVGVGVVSSPAVASRLRAKKKARGVAAQKNLTHQQRGSCRFVLNVWHGIRLPETN